jgi:hypothetical protein
LNMRQISGALLCLCSNFWPLKTWLWSPHSPYSPDLAPYDFFLFLRMKSKLKRRCFQDATGIQEQSLTVLHVIPKSQFQQRKKRWTRCINSGGDTLLGTATINTKVKCIFRYDSVRRLLDTPS